MTPQRPFKNNTFKQLFCPLKEENEDGKKDSLALSWAAV